jgi:hypothetical protein
MIPAHAAPTIQLINNGVVTECVSNICTTSDGIFTLEIVTAISNSPGGPATLTKTVNAQTNTGIAVPQTVQVVVVVSDTGFLLPSGTATLTETVNTNTPVGTTTATGTVTGTGFLSNTNTLLDTTGATTGAATVNTFLVGGAATSSVTTNFSTPFALTNTLDITFTSEGFATFTSTLAASQVPEPSSVMLFGGVLLITSGLVRRRARRAV